MKGEGDHLLLVRFSAAERPRLDISAGGGDSNGSKSVPQVANSTCYRMLDSESKDECEKGSGKLIAVTGESKEGRKESIAGDSGRSVRPRGGRSAFYSQCMSTSSTYFRHAHSLMSPNLPTKAYPPS